MEIYNEDINDLFAVENQKLQIHESLERGVFVAGLREEIVNSADQVLNLIQLGEANRHFGDTNMNARSSRSHTIFRMVIESKGKDNQCNTSSTLDDAIRVSVLNLVDLAGSERVAKTGAGGVRLKEGKHINKSLMILGNVINKLSEGGKQRGHIPYRDSKLTRILQPALGGNAKTSIICTVAPEEILTDGALLKRQKQEIEELRRKLQGSHAEVLEQEILKLRNDMLKDGPKECLQDGSTNSHSMLQEDAFSTPCFKAVPNVFVAKRSHYSTLPECSPLPDTFGDFADEDTWMRMNKGYIPDLDSLHMTPARKVQSFPLTEDCSMDTSSQEIENLHRQLKLIIEERDEYKYAEQESFNSQLTREISELQEEMLLIQGIPQNLHETVTNCKEIYKDVCSILQNFIADERSATAQILSTTSEAGTSLFSTLESHLSTAMDGNRSSHMNDYSVREQCNMLRQKLSSTISSLVLSDASTLKDERSEESVYSSKIKVIPDFFYDG
ncbi:UNVERIFIED_CONTAM: Kinesin-like protein KIN-7N [Sesamum latifolium]|uniref:Kinesin-like protein n=1 Tax=Sesamum latifolium TaxID=2727402 RepID=A0AAW2WCC2_9LAMI